MRRVNFDFSNTCPQIDAEIRKAQSEIGGFVDEILSDACPLLSDKHRQQLAEDYSLRLYQELESIFEDTRRTNEKMRDAAEEQIADLKSEIESLEAELEYFKNGVEHER